MSAVVGQVVAYKTQASPARTAYGLVTKIVSGDTVNLVALIDDVDDWPAPYGSPSYHPALLVTSVAKGTSVGQWQDVALSDVETAAIAAAVSSGTTGLATTSALNSAIAGAPLVPVYPTSRTLTLGSDFQATNTSRPARFIVSGTWTTTLTVTGTVAGNVQLKMASSANPATIVDDAQPSYGVTIVIGLTLTPQIPWKLIADAPIGAFLRPVNAGAGTVAITRCLEYPM